MRNQSYIPEKNPSWSWCIILFICCWIQFVSILVKVFASMFIRDIGLQLYFDVFVWFSYRGSTGAKDFNKAATS